MGYVLVYTPIVTPPVPPDLTANLFVNQDSGSDAYTRAEIIAGGGTCAWATFGRALALAIAGDTVQVDAGHYAAAGSDTDKSQSAFHPENSGTTGNPITFQANGHVHLTVSSGVKPTVLGNASQSYITFDGFVVEQNLNPIGTSAPIMVWGGSDVTVKNCECFGVQALWTGDNYAGIFMQGSPNAHIYNNSIHNFALSNGLDENCEGIAIYGCNYALIEHNNISYVGDGIRIKDNPAIGHSSGVVIRYNHIWQVGDAGLRTSSGCQDGCVYYQNLVEDSRSGIRLTDAYTDTILANNTINNCTWGIRYHTPSPYHLLYNNIIANNTAYAIYGEDCDPDVVTTEHNLYFGAPTAFATFRYTNHTFLWWTATKNKDGVSPIGIFTDPLFVEGSMKLQIDSPAHNLGVDVLNLLGNGTIGAIDAGCYVTGSETIGVE
jgi:parallel beta-helix repeat protein